MKKQLPSKLTKYLKKESSVVRKTKLQSQRSVKQNIKKPNLFIVGQPKSGTTALATFLEEHPEIFISKPKEPHFFCSDFHKESNNFHKKKTKTHFEFQNIKDYLKLFSNSKKEKILGEASTNYLYSKVSAKEIKNFNPSAKIIILLREPVSFLHSLHMQYSNETSENESSFEKAIELERERERGKRVPKRARVPSYLFYSKRIKYEKQIKRFLKEFPKSQIKIIIFDDFKSDNEKIYKEVLKFLKVKKYFLPKFKSVHESKSPKSKSINMLVRSPTLKAIFKSILPIKAYNSLQLKIQYLLMKKQERKSMDKNLRKKLMKKYKSEIIKLEKLLQVKGFISNKRSLIKEWGYNKI